ncbi:hypothetical protein KIN20_037291 [Parelaphostrongylus tenuis]|uniref:SAM domain-containing protein n=1 Tax=Parelaphostrongylus tenuis TaxID=148309 RepID=A0AAD5REE6_PARTN|nr:hypothetical protein KIN20_037291 [Parelaphostrongylus tenuis]
MLPDLDKSTLADLGVTAVGDQLAILRKAKDASFDMSAADSTGKLRVHIAGPADGAETLSNGSAARGEPRKGLVVRGTTGVRQGGRSVSPVDKRSPAVIRMRQEREKATMDDPVIRRLGVHGLHSDRARVISGRVQKRGVQTLENLRLPQPDDDVAICVRIPANSEVEERVFKKPKSHVSSSIVNRISRNHRGGFPRLSVKLRSTTTDNRPIIRPAKIRRKPIHSRLAKVVSGGRLSGSPRFATKPLMSSDYLVEDDLSAEDEEFMDDEMIWEEEGDDEYDTVEYVEDVRPSVYNRLSR